MKRVALSRERVIAEAIVIADTDGLEAMTVRKIGAALDAHPSSLYHHLESKEALLDGVREALYAEIALPADVTDWRVWVRELAVGYTELARKHPGAFKVFTLAQTAPSGIALAVIGLQAFAADGFTPELARDAVTGCSLAILGLALDECVLPAAPHVPPSPEAEAALLDTHPGLGPYLSLPLDRNVRRERMVEALIAGLEAAPR